MMKEVFLEGLPKTVDEATVQTWYVEEGDKVVEGQELVELVAGEESYTIQAPTAGVLAEVYFDEGDGAHRGEALCVIDDEEDLKEDLKEADEDEDEEDDEDDESDDEETDDEDEDEDEEDDDQDSDSEDE